MSSCRASNANASSSWPTATAGDARASGSRCKGDETTGHPGTSLTDAVVRMGGEWPTPTASRYGSSNNGDPGDGRDRYATAGKESLDTMAARSGPGMALNPDWVEALMGAPIGWTAGLVVEASRRPRGSRRDPSLESEAETGAHVSAPSATPSSRSARASSER